jgi:hypothetical protein
MLGLSRLRMFAAKFNVGLTRRKARVVVDRDATIMYVLKRLYRDGDLKSIRYISVGSVAVVFKYENTRGYPFRLQFHNKYYSASQIQALHELDKHSMLFSTSKGIFFGDELLAFSGAIGGELVLKIMRS